MTRDDLIMNSRRSSNDNSQHIRGSGFKRDVHKAVYFSTDYNDITSPSTIYDTPSPSLSRAGYTKLKTQRICDVTCSSKILMTSFEKSQENNE